MSRRLLIPFLCLGCLLALFVRPGACRSGYTVGVLAISPPLSFVAIKDGQQGLRGYSIDELVMLGKLMGAPFEYKAINDLESRRQLLLDGRVDFLAHDSEGTATRLGARFIPVGISIRHHLYVNSKSRSVTCMRDLDSKKVVAVIGAPYAPSIQLDKDVLWVTSPLEALTLVGRGIMDVFVAPSERVADYLIDKYRIQNILKKGVVLGETPLGLIVPNDKPELARQLQKAVDRLLASGVAEQLRDKWFGKTAFAEDFMQYARYLGMAAGAAGIGFIIIAVWNVALKRRVERVTMDLRRTEQRYRDLIESSPDMIFLVNENGDILHANERARTFLKFPDHEGVPNLQQIVTRDYVDEISAFMTKVFNDGCDKHELELLSASFHPMEVEVAGRLIQGPVQTQLLACLFARNVTERNRMEEELIQSERLGIIGKMAASLAHEINNPLGVIQANAEDIMFEGGFSPDVEEGLQAIQRNAIRAGEITKGLLDAATPKPMIMEVLEVGPLIQDALSLLGSKARRQRVAVEVPDAPLYLRGDERTLQQVLVNLVFNSLAVIPENGEILIRAWAAEDEGDATVRIEVRDTGKGIERKYLTQIFEPFFSSRKGGFGLGLFITRRMVQRHDGLIFAESEPGKGTSMFMEFPAVAPKET